MEEFEIDDFEKLYAITSARLNSSNQVKTFDEKDFDKICTLAKYKVNHLNQFDIDNREISEQDLNYYMIPIKIKQKVRTGSKEAIVEKEAYVLVNPAGYGIGIVMENGELVPVSQDEEKMMDVNDIARTLKDDERILEKPEEEEKPKEKEEQEDKDYDLLDREVIEEAKQVGIDQKVLEKIAEENGARISQISFRKIENMDKIQEDIGLNLKRYSNRVAAVRIVYGYQERYYLIDTETGEKFSKHEDGDRGDTEFPEVTDYFKYPSRIRGRNAEPLKVDQFFEENRSYITYLDNDGSLKEMKFINNGRPDDMVRAERERYVAEVEEKDKRLQDAIEEYQKNNTHENWEKVRDAMKDRIQVDKKYNVLENQKNVTLKTLESTKEQTIKESGPPKRDDEDDDWWFHGPRR